MLNNNALHPIRSNYTLTFANDINFFTSTNSSIYWTYVEELFNKLQDELLANRYLVVVNSMNYHRQEFVSAVVEEIYDWMIVSSYVDIDDEEQINPGGRCTAHDLCDYLNDNELEVKEKMFAIAVILIMTVFHPIHHFTISASNMGVTFNEFRIAHVPDKGPMVITCHTSTEVIKKYDGSWYDRISLLTPL